MTASLGAEGALVGVNRPRLKPPPGTPYFGTYFPSYSNGAHLGAYAPRRTVGAGRGVLDRLLCVALPTLTRVANAPDSFRQQLM